MKGWAIKWPSGWLDYLTVAPTRKDAWLNFERVNLNWTPTYRAKIAKQRRKGEIRAVKIELKERE